MGKRKSASKGRQHSKSKSPKRRSSKAKKTHGNAGDVRKYLAEQGHELSPFITDNNANAGLFMQTHALSSDLSKYIDKSGYNPFSPNANPQDYWKHMAGNVNTENNQFMKRLLDLNNDSQGLMLDLGGTATAGAPLQIIDKHPNSYIPVEQTGGAGDKYLNKIIRGGSQSGGNFGFGFQSQSPYLGVSFPTHSSSSSTYLSAGRYLTPPKMPAHIKHRLKDIDQMIYTANIPDKDTSKRLRGSHFQIVSNNDGFDPDKEYLFAKRQF